METYAIDEAAERTGISVSALQEMVALGVVAPESDGTFTAGHLRRIGLVASLTHAGIPLDGLVDLSGEVAVAYHGVGAVALKGVTGDTQLYRAHRPH